MTTGAQYPSDGGGGGYFDGGNDAGPGCYQLPVSLWSDGGVICYDRVQDGPFTLFGIGNGPVLADGGSGGFASTPGSIRSSRRRCQRPTSTPMVGTILGDAGPWLTSQSVNVDSRSNSFGDVRPHSSADLAARGQLIQIQGSARRRELVFDQGVRALRWRRERGLLPVRRNRQRQPISADFVRVAVLNANDAGTLPVQHVAGAALMAALSSSARNNLSASEFVYP